jgi:hypothetical protein
MDKLDRLGWAAGFSFVAYGVRVGVRANDAAVLAQVPEYLAGAWKLSELPVVQRLYSVIAGGADPRPGVRRLNLLYADHGRLARSRDLAEVFPALARDIEYYLAETARQHVFVHAGVVGWNARAIVIPGRTSTGKTTLVAALVRAGATYYSDEYAVFDGRGRVHPFARPLSIRESDGSTRRIPVEELGGKAGSAPLPLGAVVVTQHREGTHWRPRRLSPGQSVLELMANTVAIRRQPQRTLLALQRGVAGASLLLKGSRDGTEDVIQRIQRELDGS